MVAGRKEQKLLENWLSHHRRSLQLTDDSYTLVTGFFWNMLLLLSDVQDWCTLNGALLSLSVGPMGLVSAHFFLGPIQNVRSPRQIIKQTNLLSLGIDDSLVTKRLKLLSSGDCLGGRGVSA